MASHEEQSKQGEMMQQRWISRFAQERQDLSASIEKTLEDYAAQGRQWQDDEEGLAEEESRDQQSTGNSSHKPIIPPQLTLQSKALTTMRTESGADTASHTRLAKSSPTESGADTASYTRLAKSSLEASKEGEQPSLVQRTQKVNILKRLALSVTSSFAALGGARHAEPSLAASTRTQTEELSGGEAVELAPVYQQAVLPVSEEKDRAVSDLPTTSLAESADPVVAIEPAEPVSGFTQPMASLSKGQRLAARTTLVRMEAISDTPALTSEQVTGEREVNLRQEEASGMTSAQLLALDVLRDCQGITSAHLPVLDRRREARVATSAHLPVVNTLTSNVSVARHMLAGSGIFESGQKEVSVANTNVSESTVVVVMLTNDPGPVVVQYVSLQPRVGFTVHLTAPTTKRVAFNYKVMLGELV